MRGIVERTRAAVVAVAAKEGSVTDSRDIEHLISDGDTTMEDDATDYEEDKDDPGEGQGNWEMEVARVYEKTIVLLGESLDLSAAGGLE